ncbi:MAG: GFA family protein [Pikeienuella sp.]|uniref:GFA family protein n=1 Tax=Pikeienuella sp. TaxID=2831957 RepID=UPI00391DC415
MTETIRPGGCLCGALRFEATGEPIDIGWCHCRICQRSSGAPAQVWALYPSEAFRWIKGEPAIYASSAEGRREFCATCGSQVAFRIGAYASPNVGCFDEPDSLKPRRHIWTESRITWFETPDGLPRSPRDDK